MHLEYHQDFVIIMKTILLFVKEQQQQQHLYSRFKTVTISLIILKQFCFLKNNNGLLYFASTSLTLSLILMENGIIKKKIIYGS